MNEATQAEKLLLNGIDQIIYQSRINGILVMIFIGIALSYLVVKFVNWISKIDNNINNVNHDVLNGLDNHHRHHHHNTYNTIPDGIHHHHQYDSFVLSQKNGKLGFLGCANDHQEAKVETQGVKEEGEYEKEEEEPLEEQEKKEQVGKKEENDHHCHHHYYEDEEDHEQDEDDEEEEDYYLYQTDIHIFENYDTAIFKVMTKTLKKYVPPEGVELSWENPELNTYGLFLKVVMAHDKRTYQGTPVPKDLKYHTIIQKPLWDAISNNYARMGKEEEEEHECFVIGHIRKDHTRIFIESILEDFEDYKEKVFAECLKKSDENTSSMLPNPSDDDMIDMLRYAEEEDEEEENYCEVSDDGNNNLPSEKDDQNELMLVKNDLQLESDE